MKAPSLARQHAVWLVAAFLAMELLALALFVALAMRPLAQRAADDLAGLMVLSAQTWAELPPTTRPAFEAALRVQHSLRVTADPMPAGVDEWHPPFIHWLEAALTRRLGQGRHLVRATDSDGAVWYWAHVPTGTQPLVVGLPAERINSQPLLAVGVALLLGGVVAVGLAAWLARRVLRPVERLSRAAARIGQGETPDLLPEDGPMELAQLSQRFNLMAIRVRDLLAARTVLLAGVSHDLRTPLARMRLALELLKTQPSASLVDRLERDIERMNQLIANVLDLARGVSQEPAQPMDLGALLHELARDHSTAACQVQVSLPPDAVRRVCHAVLPELSLRRALGNLLDNALRHAPVCPVVLVCECTADGLRLGVLDRGPGIPFAQIEAMFQPFQRLDTSRSPATGGTGLGLAIVKELARAHGWQVSLTPREGGGMQAWVVLPQSPPVC